MKNTVIGRLLAGLGYYLALAVSTFLGAIWATGLFDRSWELPLFYRSDALSGGSQFKGTLENGWYEINPALGAPHGQTMHAFPLADNLQFMVARVLGMFIDQWSVAYNLAYLLTYPAAAVAGAWFLQRLGVSRLSAFVVGALFAFAPYHFMHGLPHLSLSMYFTVPLALSLSMALMLGRPVWARRAGGNARNPLTYLTATTLGTLLIAALVGTTSSYYAVFGLLFLGFAILIAGFERRWRDAIGGIGAAVAIVVVMLANMAPDILWARGNVDSPAAFSRAPLEAELYGLKFTSLIFPTHWNRIGDLGAGASPTTRPSRCRVSARPWASSPRSASSRCSRCRSSCWSAVARAAGGRADASRHCRCSPGSASPSASSAASPRSSPCSSRRTSAPGTAS